MIRDEWYENYPITEIGDVANANTKITVQILETKKTEFCDLTIAFNRGLGNIMIIDNEIQISQSDYDFYHKFVIGALNLNLFEDRKPNILVIGDGDGGFTKFGSLLNVDIVERDMAIVEAGAKYFGAEWDKVNLIVKSGEDFTPDKLYDGIVDAGFNNKILPSQLNRMWSWLRPGGRFVGLTTMVNDPKFFDAFKIYENWAERMDIDHVWMSMYISSYFSRQNMFVGMKELN